MSPEELDKARDAEVDRRLEQQGINRSELFLVRYDLYRELVVSNWTPPLKVSPRVLAAREWLKTRLAPEDATEIDEGLYDGCVDAVGFLAGFKAAEELAKPLVEYLKDDASALNGGRAEKIVQTYHQAMG